jgi:hypothetical protein
LPEAKTCHFFNPFFIFYLLRFNTETSPFAARPFFSTSVFQIYKNEWDLNCGLGQPASSRGKKKAVAASAMNLANRIVGGYTARDRSGTNVLNNQGQVSDQCTE